jgi:hypothetical protein
VLFGLYIVQWALGLPGMKEQQPYLAALHHRFIIGRSDQRAAIEALALAERRPAVRFNTGSLREVLPDGTSRYGGEVLHVWVPRR